MIAGQGHCPLMPMNGRVKPSGDADTQPMLQVYDLSTDAGGVTYGEADDVVELELALAEDNIDVVKVEALEDVAAALEDDNVTDWLVVSFEEAVVVDVTVLDDSEAAAPGLYMYRSSLLAAPQYSDGLPVQIIEQLVVPTRTDPALIVFPQ